MSSAELSPAGQDGRLSAALRRLASFDRARPLDLLYELVGQARRCLSVAGAGVALAIDGIGLAAVAATDERCRHLSDLQSEHAEGPLADSTRLRRSVPPVRLAAGARGADRWPRFAAAAQAEGVTGAGAVPLRAHGRTVGALVLYTTVHTGQVWQTASARLLADVCAPVLLTASPGLGVAQRLTGIADDSILVEQAKGVLAVRTGTARMEDAFHMLRRLAHAERCTLAAAAARVLDDALPATPS